MNPAEIIGTSTIIYWAVTLLCIIRTVRKKKAEFVNSAVEGNVWLGSAEVDISWFAQLYRTYVDIKGLNFVIVTNIISFIISTGFMCYLLIVNLYTN